MVVQKSVVENVMLKISCLGWVMFTFAHTARAVVTYPSG